MGFLKTRWTDSVDKTNPLPEYPRPQMERADWLSLNGVYEYAIKDADCEWADTFDGEITVPFAIESMLSGVEKPLLPEHRLWYKKVFTLPESFAGKNVLLNFGAVDWQCSVYINKELAGTHTGGYCSFSVDITRLIKDGENELVVCVYDPTDKGYQQRGKQVIKTTGFWYTATSGIWQSVWLEAVDPCHITKLRMIPDIDTKVLKFKTFTTDKDCQVNVTVFDEGNKVSENIISLDGEIKFDDIKLWSPESPFLYDLKIELLKDGTVVDTVKSYVGMRKYSVDKDENGIPRFFLNNKPYFQKGLLDQGYWSDGGLTPPCDEAMIYDIETMKRLGFNMLRKHIKLELDRWYYHCDRLGMLVWQDMMSGGEYIGVVVAGVLPFFGLKVKDNKYKLFKRTENEWRADFKRELNEMLNQLFNHTSICCWVPFNEGWGQFDSAEIANCVKQFDPTRLVDHASGWYDHGAGDFNSMHKYVVPVIMPKLDERVFALTEYGGYSRIDRGHTWDESKSFGYLMFKDKAKLSAAYKKLHEKQVIPLIKKGLSATVYTQVSDVENEVNGIMTYDRENIKVDEETLIEINNKLVL
ncbi:MAG: glycoside hydrolase family 2 [Oscillospiraceae bacterium]|nr:glycoside hydrolase family 2 [Oscillospiraceae bacterium]